MIIIDGIYTGTILRKQLHMNYLHGLWKTLTCEPSWFFIHGKIFANILIYIVYIDNYVRDATHCVHSIEIKGCYLV